MVVILYIVPDKQGTFCTLFQISRVSTYFFSYFSIKTYFVILIRNASGEVFLMSIHNICFVKSRGASNEYLQQMFP